MTVKPMQVANSMGSRQEAVVIAKREMDVITRRENFAQFQSRSLYGALDLSDNQWRQVDRMLAAYHQEGYTRNPNAEARPSTGADAWEEQRATLSRHAFSAVDARLTPAQSARFHRLYQADSWLWTVNPRP